MASVPSPAQPTAASSDTAFLGSLQRRCNEDTEERDHGDGRPLPGTSSKHIGPLNEKSAKQQRESRDKVWPCEYHLTIDYTCEDRKKVAM
jgi:hypothetical protein